MSVNLEVKGTLARLLATEDLIIEHKSVSTASFNVQSRVLTLPRWERATNNIMNLLVSHEVAHALFTPNEDFRKKTDVPMGFINVTEDVRIEVLMKKKYAGLPKTFFRGYQELHDQDFFGIEDEDVASMNVADRVNLHFKIGSFLKVPFNAEEMVVVKQCAAAVTFDDAIAAAEALYALHQMQKEEQQKEKSEEQVSAKEDAGEDAASGEDQSEKEELQIEPGEGGGSGDPLEVEGDDEGEDGEESEPTETEEQYGGGDTASQLDDKVSTMDNFSENVEDLTNSSTFGEPQYVELPNVKAADVVAANKEVHAEIDRYFARQKEILAEHDERYIYRAFTRHEEEYKQFVGNVKSEVNYMVKEFECKKSAAAYSRATTSRTGVLDCTKLHTYKYNDDIFKKVTTLPEGKNHGLVFVIDWSGSMCEILKDTVKQLLSLCMFCNKVGIPFDVYAFTNEWNRRMEGPDVSDMPGGMLHLTADFSMMNILTSKVNRKELTRQMKNIYTIACSYHSGDYGVVPDRLSLSGTPLNEALMSLRTILPEFKASNGVEKAHVMVLTDGEAAMCKMLREGDSGRTYISRFTPYDAYVRNRKTGTTLKVGRDLTNNLTSNLIAHLRTEFPESTFTGFRIVESRGGWWVRQACNYDADLLIKWKKEKSIALTSCGYNKYYVVSSNNVQESAEFEVNEGATKAKIKSAFAKSLKGKKNNKKILGDFISLIA